MAQSNNKPRKEEKRWWTGGKTKSEKTELPI